MAKDETQSEDTHDDDDAKVGGKKKLLLLIVGVLALVGIGAGLYFSGVLGGKKAEDAPAEAAAESAEGEHGEGASSGPIQPVFYELPEFIVNLNSNGKQASFLKMRIAIELEKPDDVKIVETYMPRVTDAFNSYLRELRSSDLYGSAGMTRLKEELLLRLNKSLDGVHVRNVYIKQILVQ